MVQVELSKIIIDEKRQEQIIVLKEKGGGRQFPIVIGFVEASSIKMKLSGLKPPRPITHDLMAELLKSLGAIMECLIIDKMVDSTFFAKIKLKTADGHTKLVDCRPSDGIALAVRCGSPIFVEEEVLKNVLIFDDNG